MNAHELRIRIGSARAALQAEYGKHSRPREIDAVMQAHLHCDRIIGSDKRYVDLVDTLEGLELALEEATGEVDYSRWRARQVFMKDRIAAGIATEDSAISRTAAFLELIESKLSTETSEVATSEVADQQLRDILDPRIIESSWDHLQAARYREAVLNAALALGDLIRSRTGLQHDGKTLVERAFSVQDPMLLVADLTTESGRNEQAGLVQLLSGSFIGIRNPAAHSLESTLTHRTAKQYLVLFSLLAEQVTDAKRVR